MSCLKFFIHCCIKWNAWSLQTHQYNQYGPSPPQNQTKGPNRGAEWRLFAIFVIIFDVKTCGGTSWTLCSACQACAIWHPKCVILITKNFLIHSHFCSAFLLLDSWIICMGLRKCYEQAPARCTSMSFSANWYSMVQFQLQRKSNGSMDVSTGPTDNPTVIGPFQWPFIMALMMSKGWTNSGIKPVNWCHFSQNFPHIVKNLPRIGNFRTKLTSFCRFYHKICF